MLWYFGFSLFHIFGNICNGRRSVNLVLDREQFARARCLVWGRHEEIKYGNLSKESGNFEFVSWCMNVRIYNLYWSASFRMPVCLESHQVRLMCDSYRLFVIIRMDFLHILYYQDIQLQNFVEWVFVFPKYKTSYNMKGNSMNNTVSFSMSISIQI